MSRTAARLATARVCPHPWRHRRRVWSHTRQATVPGCSRCLRAWAKQLHAPRTRADAIT